MHSIRKTLALVLVLLLFLPALGALAQEAPGFPKLTQRKALHEYAEYALAPLEKTPWNTTMADVFALWGEENMGEHHREDGASKIINLKKPIKLWKGIDCVPTFIFVEDKLTVISHSFEASSADAKKLHAQILEEMKKAHGEPGTVETGLFADALKLGTLTPEQYAQPLIGDHWMIQDGRNFISLAAPEKNKKGGKYGVSLSYTRIADGATDSGATEPSVSSGFPKLTQRKGLHEYAEYALAPLKKTPWDTMKEDVIALWEAYGLAAHPLDESTVMFGDENGLNLWEGIAFAPIYFIADNKIMTIAHVFNASSANPKELYVQMLEELKKAYGESSPATYGDLAEWSLSNESISAEQYGEIALDDHWISPDGRTLLGIIENDGMVILYYARHKDAAKDGK